MKTPLALLSILVILLVGCGGSSKMVPSPDFTLAASTTPLTIMNGGAPQIVPVAVDAVNGFTGSVTVALSGVPSGVTVSPTTISVAAGQLGQFTLTATAAAVSSSATLTFTGTSGTLSHTATAKIAITAGNTNATLSNSSFDFGGTLVGSTSTQSVVTVTNTGAYDLTLNPTLTGDPSYAIASAGSCGATLAASASCVEQVSYTPTVASGTTPVTATLNLGLGDLAVNLSQTVALTGVSAALPAGTVTATNNPQVALYSITLPYPGSITVNFGTDTTYGHNTWSQSTSTAGGTIDMLVAGMLPNTTYHMQAAVSLTNGATTVDADHSFTTKAAMLNPNLTVTTTQGMTPQPGVEQLVLINSYIDVGVVVTDLQGGVIWSYAAPANEEIDGARFLPNGHVLLTVADGWAATFNGAPPPPNNIIAVREIDLAGNIIRQITIADLNQQLAAAGYTFTLDQFHHDITPLPNGHWLVLSNTEKKFTDLVGFPGVTNVLGDVVVDLDQNLQPVWVWNEFDHLDINRHPYMFPDWTHTNAVVYSPSDGNIFVSMRHQNWVVKVAYNDGAGNGDILWHLGYQGDFTLIGGTDPVDWQYAQHYPDLFSSNSSGIFSMSMIDNGDDRVGCGVTPVCPYSTIPVFQIDEGAKTATLTYHQILPAGLYNYFGGSVDLLENNNIEYALSGINGGSDVFEQTYPGTPTTVWHMRSVGTAIYRGYRIPGLYPGVTY